MALFLVANQSVVQRHSFLSLVFLDDHFYEIPNTVGQGGKFAVIKIEASFFVELGGTEAEENPMLASLFSKAFVAIKVPRPAVSDEDIWTATTREYQILCLL